jgi:hypothetical protein
MVLPIGREAKRENELYSCSHLMFTAWQRCKRLKKKLHLKLTIFKELVCHYFYTFILCCMTDFIFPWELARFWGCCEKRYSKQGIELKNRACSMSPDQEYSVKLGRLRGTKRKGRNRPSACPFSKTAQYFDIFLTVHHSINLFNYQLDPQFLYSVIYVSH